jgi:hypothetical protein
MIINHASVNWENYIPKKVKTLVLGSFNPNNAVNNTDYYYGRISNYFWKVIAHIFNFHEDYFCGNYERKIDIMEKYGFCFYDLISSINITGINENHENNFKQIKIFTEYSDSVLFTSNTSFQGNNINVTRTYNQEILNFIQFHKPERIIHTLGNNTIDLNFNTKWKENNFGLNGFQGFINTILENCEYFEPISFSPSGRAVRVGGQIYTQNLKSWIQQNLEINL